jgi:hypothetical protein
MLNKGAESNLGAKPVDDENKWLTLMHTAIQHKKAQKVN